MSVTLSPPAQLGFPRPLTQIVKRSLYIQNPNRDPVAFKVKTTAPKQYCVRPNQGRVEPGETVEVQIVLQPLPEDPPPHAKCKDKFLVQSAFIPADAAIGPQGHTLPEVWQEIERTNKPAIQEQKIRCAYLAPEDGTGHPNGIPEENEENSPIEHSRLDESAVARGWTRWAVGEREFDPSLFPNGGHTVWEVDDAPTPKPISKARLPVIPKETTTQVQHHTTVVLLPVHGIYSAAEASPAAQHAAVDHNGDRNLPPLPEGSGFNNGTGLAAGAGALAGAGAGAGIFQHLNQQHDTAAAPATAGAPATSRDIPSLSANDVQNAGAPTNVALEKSLNASASDKEKLDVALVEIDRLRSQLNEAQGPSVTGLRKRGGAGVTEAPGASTQVASKITGQQAAGVPIEVVAGLVFAVFVLTYLFF